MSSQPLPRQTKKGSTSYDIVRCRGTFRLGSRTADIGTPFQFYYKLSQELNEDMDRVADSLLSLQSQITSLTAVALPNLRALDLLTAEKGGTCVFLGEECCYYVNESGVVTTRIKELKERILT